MVHNLKPGMLVCFGDPKRTKYSGVIRATNSWFDVLPGMIGMYIGPSPLPPVFDAWAADMILFSDSMVEVGSGVMVKYEYQV